MPVGRPLVSAWSSVTMLFSGQLNEQWSKASLEYLAPFWQVMSLGFS